MECSKKRLALLIALRFKLQDMKTFTKMLPSPILSPINQARRFRNQNFGNEINNDEPDEGKTHLR